MPKEFARVPHEFRMIKMAKSPYNVESGASFRRAGVTTMRAQLVELMENLPGSRDGVDIEALHDMRVASRRLRAVMSVFGPAFPSGKFRELEKEVSKVTDALGSVRDSDVLIEYFTDCSKGLELTHQVGTQAVIVHLQQERDRNRVELVRELNRLEKSKFLKCFNRMLEADTEVS